MNLTNPTTTVVDVMEVVVHTVLAIPKMVVDVLGVNVVFGYLTIPVEAAKRSRP